MLTINTNYASDFASSAKAASKGLRSARSSLQVCINYAKDDAAGMAISTRLTAEIEGLGI